MVMDSIWPEEESCEELDVYIEVDDTETETYLLQYPSIVENSCFYDTLQMGVKREKMQWKPKSQQLRERIPINFSSENGQLSIERAMEFSTLADDNASFLQHLEFVSSSLAMPATQPLLAERHQGIIIY